MIIKSIELENFRIYKDKNQVDLSVSNDKNIFIISGKNGFGKTTFLMSLVWCLYGRQMQEVDDLYQKEISDQGGYGKYIKNSLNRKAKADGESKFSVKVTISDAIIPELSCKEISVMRTHCDDDGETVEILIDGFQNELIRDLGTDRLSGEEIFIRDYLLPIEIAKFFFFDAEKIVTLAEVNTPEQRKKLSKAYSEILGIKKYEDIKDRFEGIQKQIKAKSASLEEQKKLNLLEADVTNCSLIIDDNLYKIDEFKEKRDELRAESRDLQIRLIRIGNTITVEELNKLRDSETQFSTEQKSIQNELQESLEIIPFVIAGGRLLSVFEQILDESNYKINAFKQDDVKLKTDNVITDLITEQRKFKGVINRDTQDFYFDTISKLVRKHFFSNVPEISTDFKPIHDFSEQEQNELNSFIQHIKLSFKEKFKRLEMQNNQVKSELYRIRRSITEAEAVAEDALVKEDRERKDFIDKETLKIEKEIDSLNIEIGKLKQEIDVKKRLISEITSKIKASETNKEKDIRAERVIQKLKKFIVKFKEQKKTSLEAHILDGLNTLMHKKGFIKDVQVQISGEDIEINLINNRGETIPKDGLSKGEQQMYATALLHGLVAESEIEFPVFIDSPMQKFDEEHAGNIIKYFYPTISDQVIIFPLVNKELTQREFKVLESKIVKAYLITNIDPDKSTFVETKPSEFFNTYNSLYNAN